MKRILAILFVCFCSYTQAADNEYLALALKFERLSSASDKNQLVEQIFPAIKSNLGLGASRKHDKRIRKYLVDVLESKEYEEGKARVYMSLYSKDELKSLIDLVSSPEYKLLQDKRGAISVGIIENMNSLILETLPNLQNDIRAAR